MPVRLYKFQAIITFQELSLEAGSYHVMDGISQCEEFAKEKGLEESASPWILVFRKEMFSPWQFLTPKEDQASASLVYHQVLKGLRAGQYRATSVREIFNKNVEFISYLSEK